MKKKVIIIIILVVVILLAGGSFWLKKHDAPPANRLKLYGNVDIRQVHLAFHDTGRIEKILVQEGDRVTAGELVAVMDPGRYQANLQKLTHELESRKQVLARMLAGSRPQEIAAAKARVKGDKAKLVDAQLTYDRLLKLTKRQYVSKQKLDDAEAALKAAREKLKTSEEVLDLAVIGPREEDISAARAMLEAARAAMEYARQELDDTKLYAPSNGIVEDRILEPGDMAFPERPVLTLALST
ncbi:MAG: biotin/lipoyl-binding protein, partial [Xanthomonadaceae bacterium]|nr:biotin/lipoyl-binding protein [Xanthomonadaceae bacterium]